MPVIHLRFIYSNMLAFPIHHNVVKTDHDIPQIISHTYQARHIMLIPINTACAISSVHFKINNLTILAYNYSLS